MQVGVEPISPGPPQGVALCRPWAASTRIAPNDCWSGIPTPL